MKGYSRVSVWKARTGVGNSLGFRAAFRHVAASQRAAGPPPGGGGRGRRDGDPSLLLFEKTPGRLAAACRYGFLLSLNHEDMFLL